MGFSMDHFLRINDVPVDPPKPRPKPTSTPFDVAVAEQSKSPSPKPSPTSSPGASGPSRPEPTLKERQSDIDAIATASPYAANAMRAELNADAEALENKAASLQRDIDAIGTAGGYATAAMQAELSGIETELAALQPSAAGVDDERPANDHTYVISTRSFAPHESFGAGFQGDDRGYSTDPGVTSRIHSTITFDTETTNGVTSSHVDAGSDPSVHHLTPFWRPQETPTVEVLSQNVERDGNTTTVDVSTKYRGKDAYGELLGFGLLDINPAPAIDVVTDLSVLDDRDAQTLTVTGQLTGDDFPATEAFITDPNGQSVFLGTGGPPSVATPFLNLIGGFERDIADISVTINTDEDGNFVSIADGDATYSIEEWNRQFTQQQPDFTEPPLVAGFNGLSLEAREAYGEIGDAASDGWRDIREADGAFETIDEVRETGGQIIAEAAEAAVSVPTAQVLGDAEAVIDIADAVLPGDGVPFVDLNLPEKPGWWPGG